MKQVVCAVLMRDNKILLARRTPERRLYPKCWDVLGGHLEADETLPQALVRDLQEEAGITPTRYYSLGIVTRWTGGEPAMLGNEHSEFRWLALVEAAELPDLALDAYRELFKALRETASED